MEDQRHLMHIRARLKMVRVKRSSFVVSRAIRVAIVSRSRYALGLEPCSSDACALSAGRGYDRRDRQARVSN